MLLYDIMMTIDFFFINITINLSNDVPLDTNHTVTIGL